MFDLLRTRFGFGLLLVLIIVVGIVLRTTGQFGLVEDVALGASSPVQGILLDLSSGVTNLFGGFRDVNALRRQVRQLEEQLNQASVDTVRVRELQIENTQLREQLEYKQANPDYAIVGATVLEDNPNRARVIGQDPSTLVNYILIDQGSADGIVEGMPVVTPAGLVGRVSSVGTSWSRVLLITDVSSSVNAVVQSSRATGIVQGQGNDRLLMRYLPLGEAVKENDIILTSGIGAQFPKRLVVGQVVQVNRRDTDLFTEAILRPSVDFNRLEYVLVLKRFTPEDITTEPTPTPTPAPTPTRAAPTPAAQAP
jgi:rod shape-determining protein MreC